MCIIHQKRIENLVGDSGEIDGFVYEEIGECLLSLNRGEEARPYFSKAYKILSDDPWLAEQEPERLARMKKLSA